MDIEQLIGSVIRGALTGRSKRHRGALGFLTGGGRGSGWITPTTVLGAAGVAWGLWETLQNQNQPTVAAPSVPPTPTSAPPPIPTGSVAGAASPATPVVPPPLPNDAATSDPVSPDVLRALRLTIASASADGTLTATEREHILAQARVVGAEALVTRELEHPTALAAICGGVAAPRMRQDLYTLAFTIVRADEQVTETERAYLADVARHLGLEPDVVTELERDAAAGIHAASTTEPTL